MNQPAGSPLFYRHQQIARHLRNSRRGIAAVLYASKKQVELIEGVKASTLGEAPLLKASLAVVLDFAISIHRIAKALSAALHFAQFQNNQASAITDSKWAQFGLN
jgi:hypothetical protein